MDNSNTAPEAADSPEATPLWPLPFPLPPGDARLEVTHEAGKRETLYRSGNIALRTIDGMVVGVRVHRVWLFPWDVFALWQVLAAALRAAGAQPPVGGSHGFVIGPPSKPVRVRQVRKDATRKTRRGNPVGGRYYLCGRVRLSVPPGTNPRERLDAFDATGLDPAAVLRDLPAVLALLCAAD
ncbi:MAG: hypothetical protein OHK0022_55280 [Roseiflexaceae bacterium]